MSIKVDGITWGGYKRADFIRGVLKFAVDLNTEDLDGLAPIEGTGGYNMVTKTEYFNSMKRFKDQNGDSHRKNYLKILGLIRKGDRWEELMDYIEIGKKEKKRKKQRKNTKLFRQEEEAMKRIRDQRCEDILKELGISKQGIKERVKSFNG